MSSPPAKSSPCLGFLTVVEHSELGLAGGYLLLTAAGRPLEFHCTVPVKPTRTQQILYGPTLLPYLCGEQIGQTLLHRSKLTPLAVCTDCQHVLAAREFTTVPLLLVLSAPSAEGNSFALARTLVATASGFSTDQQAVRDNWPAQSDSLDLAEPFARIREALQEAQTGARQAA